MIKITKSRKTHAVLIEAVPYIFEKLKSNYIRKVNVKPRNIAVTDDPTTIEIPFYYLSGSAENPMPEYYSWWGSTDKKHIEKFRYVAGDLDNYLKEEWIVAETVNKIFLKSGFSRLDILQIDVEGLDGRIIDSIDFDLFTPAMIVFERIHCEADLLERVRGKLEKQGYTLVENNVDTIAYQKAARLSFFLFWLFQKYIPAVRRKYLSKTTFSE